MPAEQRGSVYPTSRGYGIQWRDEQGVRRRQSGFTSRSEARRWFEDVERKRMRGETPTPSPLTLSELVDEYLGQHVAEANTIQALRDRLKLAVDGIPLKPRAAEREHGLGSIRVDRLDARTVGAWRKRLPAGSAWHAHKALRQVLSYAVRAKLTTENVAKLVPIRSRSGGRYLLKDGVLHVRRVYTDGRVTDYGKQDRSRRRLPLRSRAVDALRASPQGFGSSVVYPGDKGGYLNLHAWRRDEWKPALESAGLPYLVPYSMRHTFASFAIAAGVSLFYLARLMGSSVEQIDRTYGHMLPESEEYLRVCSTATTAARPRQLLGARRCRSVLPFPNSTKEAAVPVVLVHEGTGLTKQNYEETVRRITGGKGLSSPADWPVEGLLVHAAGEGPSGFRVVDVWESEEAAKRFGEMLGPILGEVGVEAEPEVYPAHTFVSA